MPASCVHSGFDIFTFDFRNHGLSDSLPGYRPMPWLTEYEAADVQAAIDYVCARNNADPQGIGVFGVSRGGNAALCIAAGDRRVRAVVTDGAFPIDGMLRHYIRRFMNIYVRIPLVARYLPDFCLISYYKCAKYWVGLRRGCRFVNVEQACRRVRQPVFMIHGERDMYVPLKVAETLRGCLSGRSKFWTVPGVKHNGAAAGAEDEYHYRIWRFFQRHLDGGRIRHAGAPPCCGPPLPSASLRTRCRRRGKPKSNPRLRPAAVVGHRVATWFSGHPCCGTSSRNRGSKTSWANSPRLLGVLVCGERGWVGRNRPVSTASYSSNIASAAFSLMPCSTRLRRACCGSQRV